MGPDYGTDPDAYLSPLPRRERRPPDSLAPALAQHTDIPIQYRRH